MSDFNITITVVTIGFLVVAYFLHNMNSREWGENPTFKIRRKKDKTYYENNLRR